jgi:F-type H+-transporting ATPase subunit b
MRLKRLLLLLIAFPLFAFANAHGGAHEVSMTNSDFFFRVLNFTIFAGLLYYLLATPLKEFFSNRSATIANQLKEIEAKLEESKKEELEAKERLQKAKEKAKEIIADGKAEAEVLVKQIEEKNKQLLSSLEKHLEEKMEVEKKKMVRETVKELLESGISAKDITLDSSKIVSIISKKVA